MSFSLKQIVPWGRSFAEYVAMFALSGDDLGKRILGCGDGPAAFDRLADGQQSLFVGFRLRDEPLVKRISLKTIRF